MDFFTTQTRAHNKTTQFVVLFIIGTIILPIFTALALDYYEKQHFVQSLDEFPWEMTCILLVGTIGIVIPIGLYKFFQFKIGGYMIAEELGGRLIDPERPSNFQEKQLMNIVAEMAIAANIPRPNIYILDQESSINAFAAGYTVNDTVIGVTKGALDVLTREELMALIGHELSHVLNEDMRINLRFTAAICGMYGLMTVGYTLILMLGRGSRSRSKDSGSGVAIFAFFAIIFMIFGVLLAFWGNIMQASVSRQREYLADASSAQFTRMPHAVASLLKKIGGSIYGSKIQLAKSKSYSHMFFSSATSQLFSTHPPLNKRILQLEPHWDGQYITPTNLYENAGFSTSFYPITEPIQNITTQTNDPFASTIQPAQQATAKIDDPFV